MMHADVLTTVSFEFESLHGTVRIPRTTLPIAPPPSGGGDSASHSSGTLTGGRYITSTSSVGPDFSVGIVVERRLARGPVAPSIHEFVMERDAMSALESREWGFKTPWTPTDPATVSNVTLDGRQWYRESRFAPINVNYVLIVDALYMVIVRGDFAPSAGSKERAWREENEAVLRKVAESLETSGK